MLVSIWKTPEELHWACTFKFAFFQMLCEAVFNFVFISPEKRFPGAGSDSARHLVLSMRHQCMHVSAWRGTQTSWWHSACLHRVCDGERGDKGCFLIYLHGLSVHICTHALLFLHQVSKINFLNPSLSLDWRHLLRVTRKTWSGTWELVLMVVLLITLPRWALFTMGEAK